MDNFNIKNSSVSQINNKGNNILRVAPTSSCKTFLDHLSSWYGLLGTTIAIVTGLVGWYALHLDQHIWFFGVK